jgi:N-acyl-D-aspartate/D-glutamate deacylase
MSATGPLDRLITGTRVFDGSALREGCNVGIVDGKIATVGAETPPARAVTHAPGHLLTPAFIDTHNHGDFHCLDSENDGHSALSQGVGTLVVGNCGYSGTPEGTPSPILLAPDGAEGVDLERHGRRLSSALPVDVSDLIGHNTLRLRVLGGPRAPTAEEAGRMAGILADFLAAGGAGMSVGLNFSDAAGADERELLPLCKILGRYGRPLTCHIRGQGERLVEAVEEVARLGEAGGCRVLVSHLRPVPGRWDPLLPKVLDRVDRSPLLFMDLYPYVAGCTTLGFFFHNSVGRVPRRGGLLPPDLVKDTVEASFPGGFDDIAVARHRTLKWEGKSVTEIAGLQGEAPALQIQRVFLEDPDCLCIYQHTSNPEAVDRVLLHPKCFVGSDGYLFASSYRGACHPRSFGAVTRFLVRYVRSGRLSPEQGLAKLTRLPARFFGLEDRGEIRAGSRANLCLFRLEALEDRADFADPCRTSRGMTEVLVGGRTAWTEPEGATRTRAGRRARPAGLPPRAGP